MSHLLAPLITNFKHWDFSSCFQHWTYQWLEICLHNQPSSWWSQPSRRQWGWKWTQNPDQSQWSSKDWQKWSHWYKRGKSTKVIPCNYSAECKQWPEKQSREVILELLLQLETWSPGEWRANLRTLASLKILKTWRISSTPPSSSSSIIVDIVDEVEISSSAAAGRRKKRDTKNGIIARTSITFMPSFKNFIFSGDPANLEKILISKIFGQMAISWILCHLIKYSRVNHAMQTVSIRDKMGFSTELPRASCIIGWLQKSNIRPKWPHTEVQAWWRLSFLQLRLPQNLLIRCWCIWKYDGW